MADDGDGYCTMALLAGADDAGSTMMEENVFPLRNDKFSATEYELQLSIQRAGFIPKRRNSDYELLETPDALVAHLRRTVNHHVKRLSWCKNDPNLCDDVSSTFARLTSWLYSCPLKRPR